MPKAAKKNFYAVRRGRVTGIYRTWPQCQENVNGFAGAQFKGFVTYEEAKQYMGPALAANGQQSAGAYAAAPSSYAPPPQQHRPAAAASYSYGAPNLAFAPSHAAASYHAAAPRQSHSGVARSHPYQHGMSPHQQQSQRFMHSSSPPLPLPPPYSEFEDYEGLGTAQPPPLPALERPDGSLNTSTPASSAADSSAAASSRAAASSAAPSAPRGPLHAVLYCDGAAKANPVGPCGAGGILYELASPPPPSAGDNPPPTNVRLGATITCYKRFLGSRSNNEAEYYALLIGLEAALAHGVTHLTVRMDSELIVKQMAGEYRVRADNLIDLYTQALTLCGQFQSIHVQHVYRHLNAEADELANEAITDEMSRRRNGGPR